MILRVKYQNKASFYASRLNHNKNFSVLFSQIQHLLYTVLKKGKVGIYKDLFRFSTEQLQQRSKYKNN